MFISRARFRILEERVEKIEQRYACEHGRHQWVMVESSYGMPFVRCPHCYAVPPKEKS